MIVALALWDPLEDGDAAIEPGAVDPAKRGDAVVDHMWPGLVQDDPTTQLLCVEHYCAAANTVRLAA